MRLSQKDRQGFYKSRVDDVAARYDDINGMVDAQELILRTSERFAQLGEKKQKRRLLMPESGPIAME